MAKWGECDFKQLTELRNKLEAVSRGQGQELDKFCEDCAKELAARLLTKVIKRTPVGQYDKGKTGGTLRRGWTAGVASNASTYAQSLKVNHFDGYYVIEIINPVEYAPYVEFGHRTPKGTDFVKGVYMMTISENELQSVAPQILQKKLDNFMKGVFG